MHGGLDFTFPGKQGLQVVAGIKVNGFVHRHREQVVAGAFAEHVRGWRAARREARRPVEYIDGLAVVVVRSH